MTAANVQRATTEKPISIVVRPLRYEEIGLLAEAIIEMPEAHIANRWREQEPIFSLQGHLVWEPRPRLWVALDGTYYWGGQVEVDGVPRGPELGNSRVGITGSLPVSRRHSLKPSVARGLSTRTGTDFETFGLSWQWTLPPRPK